MKLGSHLSIAGGVHKPLAAARDAGFQAVALFVRNQLRWHAPPLDNQAVAAFRRTRRRTGIAPVVAHGTYLANLAASGPLRRKSIAAVADELRRCGRLGIEYYVLHPGSHADPAAGARRASEALRAAVALCPHRRPRVLLETTSGAGHALGATFEQLADILRHLGPSRRFGVCLDTCHVFAAGYDIRTPSAYGRTMEQFDRAVGIARLGAIHLNDSLGPLGSRRDRHAHIGAGKIGTRGFGPLLRDPRLASLPMILETPKGTDARGRDWDRVNAAKLRRLLRR